MIALCHDHGMDAVAAGGLLAIMGLFDLVGTNRVGLADDRIDPRKLLFAYYGLRGLSLIYLPFANFTFFGLSLFAMFYGLDWIATVPPTLAIANRTFRHPQGPDPVRLDRRQPPDRRPLRLPFSPGPRAPPQGPIWTPLSSPALSRWGPPSWR